MAEEPRASGVLASFAALVPNVSPADAQRFAQAANGFIAALLDDPRVLALFDAWSPAMERAWLSMAARVVKTARRESLTPEASWFRTLARDGRTAMTFELRRVYARAAHPALRLIERDLGILWPWPAVALVDACGRKALARRTGKALEPLAFIARELDITPAMAPPIAVRTMPVEGESLVEARIRIDAAYRTALEQLDAAGRAGSSGYRGRRRAPRRDTSAIVDGGRWLYDIDYRDPRRSITEIARALPRHKRHDDARAIECGCRTTVYRGIKEARRLLSLCAVTWPTTH